MHSLRKGRIVCMILVLLAFLTALEWLMLFRQIPDCMLVPSDQTEEKLLSDILPPWLQEETIPAAGSGKSNIPKENLHLSDTLEYTVECSLLGVIPVKEMQVEVVERKELVPGGEPVGIYMKTEGVLIVGTGEVCDINGLAQEPGGQIVKSGDYILEVNHVPVTKKEEVTEQINKAAGNEVELTLFRNGEEIEVLVPVVQTGLSEYKAGIWVRDDTQGIGTLTYQNANGNFGALGHGISDIDTSTLLTLQYGRLYQADIRSVIKGENGAPGELAGVIRYNQSEVIGTISENTGIGIFGTLDENWKPYDNAKAVEVGYKQEIKTGPAVIRSAVSGEVKDYDIEIEKINMNSSDANKSMVIRVTDPELLALTGGIVQGMSGSPILQSGRIVGAVTHVFVNDPAKGYGIFIENMLEH